MIWFTIISVFCLLASVNGIDENNAKEQNCFPIEKTVNSTWGAPSKLYYPLMSRLALYRMAQYLLGRPYKDIDESELYYDSCIYFTQVEPGSGWSDVEYVRGFGGKSRKFNMSYKMMNEGFETWEFNTSTRKQKIGLNLGVIDPEYSGSCHTTMTDNKTFIVSACCTNGDQMIWDVSSSLKKLPKDTVQKIHEHLISIGFKQEYFTRLQYNSC